MGHFRLFTNSNVRVGYAASAFSPLTLELPHPDIPPFSILPLDPTEEPDEIADKGVSHKSQDESQYQPGGSESAQIPTVEVEEDNPATPTQKPQRLSLLKFRHASDPQLSTTYRNTPAPTIPVLPPPAIITTSPTTSHLGEPVKKRSVNAIFKSRKFKEDQRLSRFDSSLHARPATTQSTTTLPSTMHKSGIHQGRRNAKHLSNTTPDMAPPPYGDEMNSSLAIPITRLSESSRSDESSEGQGIIAQTTTTHTISTTTTFFQLPRRKKDKGPLFPLPPLS